MINYTEWATILPTDINGFSIIRITEGFFKGIEYTYGGVAFEEGEDAVTLRFEYNIRIGDIAPTHEESFKQFSGEILCSIMDSQLYSDEVVYSNGTD